MIKHSTIQTKVCGYRMEISFDYSPASKGERERGSGVKLSPDEPAEVEITGVKLLDPEDMYEIITEEVNISFKDALEAVWEYTNKE